MKCIKCSKEIADGASFCQHCGTNQTMTNSLVDVLKELEAYPMVFKSFEQVVKLFNEKNYNFAANAMRQTVEGMVDFIFSNCKNANMNLSLKEQIELLYSNNLITTSSYNNYTKIRYFGNKYSHISDKSATSAECEQYFNLLTIELLTFLNTYAKFNYSNIVIEKKQEKSKIIFNFCRNIFIKIFGMVFAIMGGFFAYEGFYEVFSKQGEIFGIVFGIVGSFFCLIGLSILIGGAKVVDFIEKINRRI